MKTSYEGFHGSRGRVLLRRGTSVVGGLALHFANDISEVTAGAEGGKKDSVTIVLVGSGRAR